jgi:membrane protease YdiL (CAAX protease family)
VNDSEKKVRLEFHLALALGIVPGLGALASFFFASQNRARDIADVWVRRLRWLAVVDVLVLICVVFLTRGSAQPASPAVLHGRIGLVPAATGARDGLSIEKTLPDSPADRAGIKSGDVIVTIDLVPVHNAQDLILQINRHPFETRSLHIRRGMDSLDVQITPEPMPGMFVPSLLYRNSPLEPWNLVQIILTIAALVALAFRARSRGIAALPAALIFASFVFATLVQEGVGAVIARFVGGQSTGGWLLSTLTFTAALLAAAAFSLWLSVRRRIIPAAHWHPPRISFIGRAMLYVFSLGLRAAILAWAFCAATGLLRFFPANDPWALVDGMPQIGAMAFAFGAVVLAPAGEEILFRGLFLPWLEQFFSARDALLVSAAVFGLQHIVYGPGAAFIVVVGLVLGWARQRTGGLAAPVFIHTLNNAFASLLRAAFR